jgi:hypothetical protein
MFDNNSNNNNNSGLRSSIGSMSSLFNGSGEWSLGSLGRDSLLDGASAFGVDEMMNTFRLVSDWWKVRWEGRGEKREKKKKKW